MNDKLSAVVRETFVQLYNEGLIYKGLRLVNWDPKLQSAVSDLEVESEEENGHMWEIRYPAVDGSEGVVVATTRPETLFGDQAVAVHPDDERYKHLVGKMLKLPLTDREIPVIADEYVDKDFGSGCVKITPAHDFNDFEVGKRHNLEMLSVLDKTAHMNTARPSTAAWIATNAARPLSKTSKRSAFWSTSRRISTWCRACPARAKSSNRCSRNSGTWP